MNSKKLNEMLLSLVSAVSLKKNKRGNVPGLGLLLGVVLGLATIVLAIFITLAFTGTLRTTNVIPAGSLEANSSVNVLNNFTAATNTVTSNFGIIVGIVVLVVIIILLGFAFFYFRRFSGTSSGGSTVVG